MVGRVSGQYSLEALNSRKARRSISYSGGYMQESDNADISSFGALLAKATADMRNIPEVREEVVANFKGQIESGKYNPPLEKLANVLYVAGMLDTTEE